MATKIEAKTPLSSRRRLSRLLARDLRPRAAALTLVILTGTSLLLWSSLSDDSPLGHDDIPRGILGSVEQVPDGEVDVPAWQP